MAFKINTELTGDKPGREEEVLPERRKGTGRLNFKVIILFMLAVAAAWLIAYLFHGNQGKRAHEQDNAHPVNIAVAEVSQVPIQIRSIGNVTPYSTVNVTPQVSGQLARVFFTQGQMVKKGDLLCQIDPRPYQAALDQAEGTVAKDRALIDAAKANMVRDMAQVGQLQANLNKDMAQLAYASTEKKRYAELVKEGAVSKEQSDQMNTSEDQARAIIDADKKAIENGRAVLKSDQAQIATAAGTLQADQGAAENAKIQLEWCEIRSPIDGRTSSLNVYQGNVVAAGSTNPIVTIAQIEPIYVTVTVPEQYLNDVRRSRQEGSLKMQALIEGMKTDSVDGTISFIENTVNTSTGTVMLRASFANENMHLYPGQFVDVVLTMPPAAANVSIPARALQTTQQGQSVYVVHGDKVELRAVTVSQTFGDRAAITKGLAAGEAVVTDGQMQLSPGASVAIQPDKGAGGAGLSGGMNARSVPSTSPAGAGTNLPGHKT